MSGHVLSLRLICNRILLRMSQDGCIMISELNVDEAKAVLVALDRGIEHIERGDSEAPDFETFLAVLNRS